MPALGARALFPASRPRFLPHTAAAAAAAAATTVRGRTPAVRTFRSAQALGSRPGHSDTAKDEDKQPPDNKPGGEEVGAAEKNNDSSSSSSSSQPADTRKSGTPLRNQALGFGRSRAARKPAESLPPVVVPHWFTSLSVFLSEEEDSALVKGNELEPLQDWHLRGSLVSLRRYRESLARFLRQCTEELTSCSAGAESKEESWTRLVSSVEKLQEQILDKANRWYGAALLEALTLTYHGSNANPGHLRKFRELYRLAKGDTAGVSEWVLSPITAPRVPYFGRRWLAGIDLDEGPDPNALYGNSWSRLPKREFEACVELLAAVRAGLADKKSPADFKKPVPLLTILNYKGSNAALVMVRMVAKELEADVVHMDAHTIATVVGRYLGQSFWTRDSVSMLGFDAADMTGRLASSSESGPGAEQAESTVTLMFSRSGSIGPKSDTFLGKDAPDARWDDIKLRRVLEELVRSADRKHEQKRKAGEPTRSPKRPLIIHLHDYVEISSLNDSIVQKLRLITERMWQEGRKVIVVGSTSSDVKTVPQWRDQVAEVAARDDHHVIACHATDVTREWWAKMENVFENLANIQALLQESEDPEGRENEEIFELVKLFVAEDDKVAVRSEGPFARYPELAEILSANVHDASWCRRVATLILGQPEEAMHIPRWEQVARAIKFVTERDGQWKDLYPDARPPYFSPLASPPSRFTLPFGPSGMEDLMPRASGGSSSKNFDQYEKKLLSGLINAKDLRTTFDEVVVPPETKDSIKTLTSLSLLRPDAFSYGVLKTERIPGCLLYGPPGTGKTLLAKAVAKESGANMLEVSAASINEMWVGQSEKNVRALFSLARKMSPMVIFLDEGDALLGARSSQRTSAGRREIISEFLREWDGMSDMRAFIMVATNRPFDLDEAVLRRLPRKILVDLPLRDQRAAILQVMLRDEELDPSVDVAGLAAATELYSGSDLKNLCVAAAMEAVRDEEQARIAHAGPEPFALPARRVLTAPHFDKALRQISASISEDMDSLKAIRKFDEQYGDAGRRRRARRAMGFEVAVAGLGNTEEARVRQAVAGIQ